MHHREANLWNELSKLRHPVGVWSKYYKVSSSLVFAIIYVEMQQYQLFNIQNVLRRLKLRLSTLSFLRAPGNLAMHFGASLGVTHIKPLTISRANRFVQLRWGEPADLYLRNPEVAVRYTCGILRAFIEQWSQECDLADRPEILATLYNVSDFANKPPHPSPRVGGFVGPLFVDGTLYPDVCFGERVRIVQESVFLEGFLQQTEAENEKDVLVH